jgi:hypothetical protein
MSLNQQRFQNSMIGYKFYELIRQVENLIASMSRVDELQWRSEIIALNNVVLRLENLQYLRAILDKNRV